MIDNLDIEVKNILRTGEEILNFSLSKSANSAYFIIIREENEFITFRISNHSTNSFYSNRTFDSRKSLDDLLREIRNYMDMTQWYCFK